MNLNFRDSRTGQTSLGHGQLSYLNRGRNMCTTDHRHDVGHCSGAVEVSVRDRFALTPHHSQLCRRQRIQPIQRQSGEPLAIGIAVLQQRDQRPDRIGCNDSTSQIALPTAKPRPPSSPERRCSTSCIDHTWSRGHTKAAEPAADEPTKLAPAPPTLAPPAVRCCGRPARCSRRPLAPPSSARACDFVAPAPWNRSISFASPPSLVSRTCVSRQCT